MSEETLASDDERERAVARLRDASAEGRLPLEELAARTEAAYVARTHGELVQATAGLPAAAPPGAARSRTRFVIGALTPVRKRGRLQLGERTVVIGGLAPVTIDLRDATVAPGATLTVLGLLAPVTVLVPEHVEVESDVVGILAPVDEPPAARTPATRIRVKGCALLAPVSIQVSHS